MTTTWLPDEQWAPAKEIPIRSVQGARSAQQLNAVLGQFPVMTHKRYRPVPPHPAIPATAESPAIPEKPKWDTYCKTLAEDVAAAMGVPFPHWVDTVLSGNPARPGNGAVELNINAGLIWLRAHGCQRFGWVAVPTELEARAAAMRGELALAVWKNPGGHGHVVPLKPPRDGDDKDTTWCMQAGLRNFEHGKLTEAFPKGIKPDFFIHS